jgi:hypothetical protein
MATRLTPLGMLIKWFIVPLVLCAIGYFLVGPRVEEKVPTDVKDNLRKVAGTVDSKNEPETDKPKKSYAAPEVDVTVTALNTRQEKPKKKRRRRTRTTPKTSTPSSAPEAAPSVAPPPAVSEGENG